MNSNLKILLVDDDPDIIDQTKLLLTARGYNVISADNPDDGYKLFVAQKPDVVITDLMMDELDSGFLFTYKIKKTEHGKQIPVILMTSAAHLTGYKFDSVSKDEKDWLKCDAVLNKPVVVEDIIAKIDAYYETKS